MHPLLNFVAQYTYAGIFISLGLGIIGLPLPDETILAFAGFMIYKGKLLGIPAFLSSFAGTSCGITTGYLIGRYFGHSVIDRHASKLHLRHEHITKARQWYDKYGKFALAAGYFIPGVRHLSAIIAGASLLPYRVFAFYAYIGGFLWVMTFILFGYLMGEEWHKVLSFSYKHIIPASAAGLLVIILAGIISTSLRKSK
jgi:membrane protein DedA with SNARE-associated domain